MKLYSVLIGIVLTGAIHIAHGDLQGPTQQLCERVKTCAYENPALDSSNAGNQVMLEMLIDSICVQIAAPIAVSLEGSEHEADAKQCIDDVLDLDCSALMSGQAKNIESCESVKQPAESSGVNVN